MSSLDGMAEKRRRPDDRRPGSEIVTADERNTLRQINGEVSANLTNDFLNSIGVSGDLSKLIDSWEALPEHIKQTIISLVDASRNSPR